MPVHIPIDGTLDLHAFRPSDIKLLIPDYLEECRSENILHVRLIHGKGTGALRRSVHAILDRIDYVTAYRIAGLDGGSWGATLVDLQAAQ
jgi:DNA-nicking Smr family endonuclease